MTPQKPTIRFKSIKENYDKEKSGIKNNTLRFTDDWTPERWEAYSKAEIVIISNKENPRDKFQREITDKTKYKNVVIITWKNQQ